MKVKIQSTGRRGCLGERCCFPHRSSSSGPSPPPSVCAASSSSHFQPPAIETILLIHSTYKTFQINCLHKHTHTPQTSPVPFCGIRPAGTPRSRGF